MAFSAEVMVRISANSLKLKSGCGMEVSATWDFYDGAADSFKKFFPVKAFNMKAFSFAPGGCGQTCACAVYNGIVKLRGPSAFFHLR